MRLRPSFMRAVTRTMRSLGQDKARRCRWQVLAEGRVLAKTEERWHAERVVRNLGRGEVSRLCNRCCGMAHLVKGDVCSECGLERSDAA